jgi:hypothetical protein
MCSSGWARVAMERQAKRVCTDVGEEALMESYRESEGCHTTPHHTTPKPAPRDPVPFGKDHTTYQHSIEEIAPDSATLKD